MPIAVLDDSVDCEMPSMSCLALSGHIAREPSHDCLRIILSSVPVAVVMVFYVSTLSAHDMSCHV